jgi:hypothetical protein
MNADQSNHAGFAIAALPQGDGRRGRVQFLFDLTVTGTLIRIRSAMPNGRLRDFKWACNSPLCVGVNEKREDDRITHMTSSPPKHYLQTSH